MYKLPISFKAKNMKKRIPKVLGVAFFRIDVLRKKGLGLRNEGVLC